MVLGDGNNLDDILCCADAIILPPFLTRVWMFTVGKNRKGRGWNKNKWHMENKKPFIASLNKNNVDRLTRFMVLEFACRGCTTSRQKIIARHGGALPYPRLHSREHSRPSCQRELMTMTGSFWAECYYENLI